MPIVEYDTQASYKRSWNTIIRGESMFFFLKKEKKGIFSPADEVIIELQLEGSNLQLISFFIIYCLRIINPFGMHLSYILKFKKRKSKKEKRKKDKCIISKSLETSMLS